MATNGKNDGNNMTPNMSFTDNSSNEPQKGIFGYLENRGTKSSFAKDYWKEGSGYLDSALKDLKEMQKLYKELEKSQDKMNTSQENQFKSQKRALELQIATLEDIKQTQDVNDRDALRSITDSNKLRNKGLLEYQKLLDNIAKRQETLKSGDKELASQLREDAEYINELYASMNKEIQQQNLNIEVTGEKLKNNTSSFSKAMSETLKSASDELKGLLDTFNLNKLANSGLNKFLTDKIAIQNDMMKQFGFETKSQYLSFKDGLDESLANMNKDMGNIFSGKDLTNYMQNMSSIGITNTKMAQDQMRASIMGSKYLGVSAETQQEMFKWMKRTNDYEMLDEHNKVITGLLKSQLGVSKEQLDIMTQALFSENDTMAAIGMSNEAIEAVNQAGLIGVATLAGDNIGISPEIAAKMGQMYEQLITTNPSNMGKWAKLGISDAFTIQGIGQNSTDLKTQYLNMQQFLKEMQNSVMLSSPNKNIRSELISMFGEEYTDVFGALQDLNFEEWQNQSSKAFENVDEALKSATSVMEEIKETTEVTWLEQIYNKIDQWITAWDSANLTSLANTYFTLWAGSKIFDIASKFSSKNVVDILLKSGEAQITMGSTGSGILASGGGVALSAAAIAAISAAFVASVIKTNSLSTSNDRLTEFAEKNDNKTWFGKGVDLVRAGLSSGIGTVGIAIGNSAKATPWGGALTLMGKGEMLEDKALIAKSKWLRTASNFTSGLYGVEDSHLYRLAALMAFDKADWLRYTDNTERHEEIVKEYNSLNDKEKARVKGFAFNDEDLGPLSKDIDWGNYHKAGLDRVPRDNYKALLHKNEMVLNEKDAELLRKRDKAFMRYTTNTNYNGPGFGGSLDMVGPHHSGYAGHNGIDLYFDKVGTQVGSAVPGTVIESKDIPGNYNDGKKYHGDGLSSYGRVIKIKGDNGHTYIYAHLSKRLVAAGQKVNAGDLIGLSGSSGNSSGPHLHFEVAGAGTGEAAHAKYYTPSVRNIGDTSGANWELSQSSESTSNSSSSSPGSPIASVGTNISSDGSTSSTKRSRNVPVSTGRFLPSSLASKGGIGGGNEGIGGADKVVHSVDGGFSRLLNYLDNIRSEQSAQREMLNAFSRLNSEGNTI